MANNGEGIYATRPWKINGEGPAMGVAVDPNARFNEGVQPDLGAQDIRFTAKGSTLYAFVQGWPRGDVTIRALGTAGAQSPATAADVQMLGRNETLKFTQDQSGLRVTVPAEKPTTADIGISFGSASHRGGATLCYPGRASDVVPHRIHLCIRCSPRCRY